MKNDRTADQARRVVADLRDMRDFAERRHGPNARSTRRIQEALDTEESRAHGAGEHSGPRPQLDRQTGKAA